MSDETPPDFQPTLCGNSVLIRPIRPDDWDEMFAAASDPLIWEVHPVSNRYQEPVFRHFFDGAIASASAFAFVERESGAIIGSSRYAQYDPQARSVEIGYTFLIRRHWGGATNAEVKRLMLDHAFTFADVVFFEVGHENWRSRGAMTKIGGVLRDGYLDRIINGTTYRHVVFEIRKPGREP